jgi:signal transduction histidine kinase
MIEPKAELCLEVIDMEREIPVLNQRGIGSHSMRERAEELGGSFTVEALPNKGTRIVAVLPLKRRGRGR